MSVGTDPDGVHGHGLTIEETAERLGLTQKMVSSAERSALRKLRAMARAYYGYDIPELGFERCDFTTELTLRRTP